MHFNITELDVGNELEMTLINTKQLIDPIIANKVKPIKIRKIFEGVL